MKKRSILYLTAGLAPVIMLLVIAVWLQGFGTPELSKLDEALRSAGYQRYNPPRTNWGPGFVFAGDLQGNRVTNVQEICPNLYSNAGEPRAAKVLLPNYSATDRYSFDLAVTFLKTQLDEVDFSAEQMRSIDVNWMNIRETSYTRMDQWLETGEPRPVEKPCRSAIEDMKQKNQFKGRIFVIVRAVAPEKLIYDFSKVAKARGAMPMNLSNNTRGGANGKIEIVQNTQLHISEPMYIGYSAPLKLDDWVPSNLLSGEIVSVRASKSNITVE